MLATRAFPRVLVASRRFVCRPCANLASHPRLTPSSRPFATTPWCGKGGLRNLGRSKDTVDRSEKYRLPIMPARTRFAPSPTGYLHLGSLRTALYNCLLAKGTRGQFIVRVEDTDQQRVVGDAEKRLFADLRWANLSWDEGPDVGGPCGPYRQSERLDKYRPHADQLIESGHAYRCFCTASDLEKHKEHAATSNQSTRYPGTCRSIPAEESADRAASGETHVVRFKGGESLSFVDRVYGKYEKNEEEEDFILIKSDGYPTYHFANVVDDHLMKITHVVRGAEWLISTPKHIALYNAFGWSPPEFSHVGLLVDANGQKLSKRNHDVDVSSYRRRGYVPSALNNWLVLLGWGLPPWAKKGSDVFPEMKDIINQFSFKFTKGTIKVNPEKLDSFQHKHIDHLLEDPLPNIHVLHESVIQPVESFIRKMDGLRATLSNEEVKSSSGRVLNFYQLGNLLPQFATPELAGEYIIDLFHNNTTKYPKVTDFVIENPQLIWNVPHHVYEKAAQSMEKRPNIRVLKTVEGELDALRTEERPWDKRRIQSAINAAITTLQPKYYSAEEARDAVYAGLRFGLMGDPDQPSKPANAVIFLLGREETSARFARATEALR